MPAIFRMKSQKPKAEHEYELFKVKRSNADNKAVEQLKQAI